MAHMTLLQTLSEISQVARSSTSVVRTSHSRLCLAGQLRLLHTLGDIVDDTDAWKELFDTKQIKNTSDIELGQSTQKLCATITRCCSQHSSDSIGLGCLPHTRRNIANICNRCQSNEQLDFRCLQQANQFQIQCKVAAWCKPTVVAFWYAAKPCMVPSLWPMWIN
jgi:hypothetical protein